MPKKLSLQNAKKQVVEYMIYIITMVITVALLLSFNMIIFSEEIAAIINEKSILPLILITVSVLVVLVISALVKHITVFMVRRGFPRRRTRRPWRAGRPWPTRPRGGRTRPHQG